MEFFVSQRLFKLKRRKVSKFSRRRSNDSPTKKTNWKMTTTTDEHAFCPFHTSGWRMLPGNISWIIRHVKNGGKVGREFRSWPDGAERERKNKFEIAAVSSGFRLFDLGFVGVHTKRTCVGARLATSQRVTNHYFLSERNEADEGRFWKSRTF